MEHDWKALYVLYRDLVRRYRAANSKPYIGLQVLQQASFSDQHSYKYMLNNSLGLSDYLRADWDKIELFRDESVNEKLTHGRDPDDPSESVFQVAIQILQRDMVLYIAPDDTSEFFYRGQRRHDWLVI